MRNPVEALPADVADRQQLLDTWICVVQERFQMPTFAAAVAGKCGHNEQK